MSLLNNVAKLTKQAVFRQFLNISKNDVKRHHRWVMPTLKELKRRRDKIGPEEPSPRSSYLEWNYDGEVYAFGKRLNENFDEDLLKTALVNRSYNLDNPDVTDNSDLIREGDEIIERYLKDKFKSYPQEVSESILNHLRSTSMLAHVASHMGLRDIILTKEFPVEDVTLASTFKAVVAALEKSQDSKKAEKFVNDFLIVQLNGKDLFDLWEPKEPYEKLEKELEKRGINNIEPRLCNAVGKNTILAAYRVGLYVDKKLIGSGWGETMDIARSTAACNALQKLYVI